MKKETSLREFFYPQHGVTVKAESQEEADKMIGEMFGTKKMDESKIENKGIPGRVSNK